MYLKKPFFTLKTNPISANIAYLKRTTSPDSVSKEIIFPFSKKNIVFLQKVRPQSRTFAQLENREHALPGSNIVIGRCLILYSTIENLY